MLTKMRAWLHTSDIRAYPLYSVTIFLSAFLLFQVQPMIARYMLPFFGGAVSVWAASLVFFTTALFLGYTYVYALSALSPNLMRRIHIAFLAVTGTLIIIVLATGSVYPPFEWVFSLTDAPALQVLLALSVCIGIPYILLSTTGPLLQHWYAEETKKEPYHLYALSNAGSLLALLSYPFLIEPALSLSSQQHIWSVALLGTLVLLGVLAWRRTSRTPADNAAEEVGRSVPILRIITWVALSALPAAMLVATTTSITQTLTPFPFLWIMPLSLYLVSFIIAFRGWGASGITASAVIAAAIVSYIYLDWKVADASRQMLANLTLFFYGALYCHALLYSKRPEPGLSSFFYFWTSLGGAIGTLIAALIAPVLFVDVFEFSIGISIFAALAIIGFPAMRYVKDEYKRGTIILKGTGFIVLLMMATHTVSNHENTALEISRNFFGVVQVHEQVGIRTLQHGVTLHGMQFLDETRKYEPVTYYGSTSGVGRAVLYARENRGSEIAVGVIGLGAGTLAAYCLDNDHFTFYEIDPRMGRIANQYFSYLSFCKNSEIVYGDGRLSLARALEDGKKGNFDVLVVDAFSDDTIPVHLLTKEAVALYIDHLRSSQSVLAIHTSNRFFSLSPVVMRAAYELGLSAMVIVDSPETDGATHSQWVVLASDASVLQKEIFSGGASVAPPLPADVWTDDYANIFSSFNRWSLRVWRSDQ